MLILHHTQLTYFDSTIKNVLLSINIHQQNRKIATYKAISCILHQLAFPIDSIDMLHGPCQGHCGV